MLTVEHMNKCPNCEASDLQLLSFNYEMLNSIVVSIVLRRENYECGNCLGVISEEWVIKSRKFTPQEPDGDGGEKIELRRIA